MHSDPLQHFSDDSLGDGAVQLRILGNQLVVELCYWASACEGGSEVQ
jgi:hypothetical protein